MTTSKKGKNSLADLNAFLKQQQGSSPDVQSAEDFVRQTPRSLVGTLEEAEALPAREAPKAEPASAGSATDTAEEALALSPTDIAAQIQALADARGVSFQRVYAEVLLHRSPPAVPAPLLLADYALAYATFPLTLLRYWQEKWLR